MTRSRHAPLCSPTLHTLHAVRCLQSVAIEPQPQLAQAARDDEGMPLPRSEEEQQEEAAATEEARQARLAEESAARAGAEEAEEDDPEDPKEEEKPFDPESLTLEMAQSLAKDQMLAGYISANMDELQELTEGHGDEVLEEFITSISEPDVLAKAKEVIDSRVGKELDYHAENDHDADGRVDTVEAIGKFIKSADGDHILAAAADVAKEVKDSLMHKQQTADEALAPLAAGARAPTAKPVPTGGIDGDAGGNASHGVPVVANSTTTSLAAADTTDDDGEDDDTSPSSAPPGAPNLSPSSPTPPFGFHYCDTHGPSEQPCCALTFREEQAKCLAAKKIAPDGYPAVAHSAPPSPSATSKPKCMGKSSEFNAGYGGCDTYQVGNGNYNYCQTDIDFAAGANHGKTASQVCGECEACKL